MIQFICIHEAPETCFRQVIGVTCDIKRAIGICMAFAEICAEDLGDENAKLEMSTFQTTEADTGLFATYKVISTECSDTVEYLYILEHEMNDKECRTLIDELIDKIE